MFDLVPLLFSVLIVSVGVNGQNRWSDETLNLTTGIFLISENATTGKLSVILGSFIRFLLTICSPFAKREPIRYNVQNWYMLSCSMFPR